DTVRPKIIIGEIVEGCKLTSSSSSEQSLDSLVDDTTFTIYKFLPTDINFQTNSIFFSTNLKSSRIINARWLIGNETTPRNGNKISVDFNTPIQEITAKLIINWRYSNGLSSFTDTIEKKFHILSRITLFGDYFGANADDTASKYIVTIGSMIDSTYDTPQKIWGIQNLLRGYPYKLEIVKWSRGFGICSALGPKYYFQMAGEKYSFPFSFGLQNKSRDSISIDYSFYRIDPNTSFNDSFIVKKFIGKKL
ncbi:MAG: hypothetical protein SGJ04_10920, partial [Bacteroidota bacterium]|nr:hypothetical protein [Bacteroidota bacterium]